MKDLKNKVAVVTGVGSGIGRALAELLAKEGCKLSLNELNVDRLNDTIESCKQINPSIEIYSDSFDVSIEEDMHKFAQNTIAQMGHVDIMINNAGVAISMVKAESIKKSDFDWIMGINFWGMVYGSQAFVPHLKARKESALVNVSSLFGLVGIAYQAAYCSTKFAIRGYTESLRMEVLNDAPHVTIHTVHPGGIATNIANDAKDVSNNPKLNDPSGANELLTLPPSKAAQIIIDHVKKKKHRIIIGKDAKQGDWLQRIWPEKYTGMIWKSFKNLKGLDEV